MKLDNLIKLDQDVTLEIVNRLKHESDRWKIAILVPLLLILFIAFVMTAGFGLYKVSGGEGSFKNTQILMIVIFLLMVVMFVAIIVAVFKTLKYRLSYKLYFSHRVLAGILEDYEYKYGAGISRQQLGDTGMVRFGNRYSSEDFVAGKYKDVRFAKSDVTIQDETTDSDGDTHTDTYFRGQWMIFEFPRRFVTKLAVVGGGCRRAIYTKGMEKFSTESSEFNKRFKVYMQDGVEMFYLLEPKMIERIQALYDAHLGNIALLFVDKKLHIALNNNADSFEPPKRKRGDLVETEEIERLKNEFKTVFDLIDMLELDKKLFKAE